MNWKDIPQKSRIVENQIPLNKINSKKFFTQIDRYDEIIHQSLEINELVSILAHKVDLIDLPSTPS
jgi:hypothetical protein